jgi:hypothetical protein
MAVERAFADPSRHSENYCEKRRLSKGPQCMSRNSPTPNAGPNNVDTTTNNMGLSTMVLTPQTQSRADPTRYPQKRRELTTPLHRIPFIQELHKLCTLQFRIFTAC